MLKCSYLHTHTCVCICEDDLKHRAKNLTHAFHLNFICLDFGFIYIHTHIHTYLDMRLPGIVE